MPPPYQPAKRFCRNINDIRSRTAIRRSNRQRSSGAEGRGSQRALLVGTFWLLQRIALIRLRRLDLQVLGLLGGAMVQYVTDSLPPGEQEIISGFANKIGFWGGPGGRLVLTDRRLIFTNRRKTKIRAEYLLSDVIYIGTASNATIWTSMLLISLLLRNGIKVTLRGGQSQRFVVNDRNRWVALVKEYSGKVAVTPAA